MARHRIGEIAVRLLDQKRTAVLGLGAAIGEVRLVARSALEFAGARIERPRLADEVEAEVGERDVLLEGRRARQPLGHAMAEDQRQRRRGA